MRSLFPKVPHSGEVAAEGGARAETSPAPVGGRRLLLRVFVLLACAAPTAFAAELFRERALSASPRNAGETAYERIQKNPATLRSKVVQIDESALQEAKAGVTLFDEKADFAIARNEEGVWKGKGENSARFSLRKTEAGFSGYLIHAGHRFAITPLGDGTVALYEQEGGACQLSHPKEN